MDTSHLRALVKPVVRTFRRIAGRRSSGEDNRDAEGARIVAQPPPAGGKLAFADGLRGIATVIVVLHHWTLGFYPSYRGAGDGHFVQRPFIRLISAGDFGVYCFFVLSGYVLSFKAWKMLHSGKSELGFRALSSSVLRRLWRLAIPVWVSTIFCYFLLIGGAYDSSQKFGSGWMKDASVKWQCKDRSKWCEFKYVLWNCAFLWTNRAGPSYNSSLWTMPTEFQNSLIVYLVTLALMRLRVWPRRIAGALHMFYFWYIQDFYTMAFLMGVQLSDVYAGKHFSARPENVYNDSISLSATSSATLSPPTSDNGEEDEDLDLDLEAHDKEASFLPLFAAPGIRSRRKFRLPNLSPSAHPKLYRVWIAVKLIFNNCFPICLFVWGLYSGSPGKQVWSFFHNRFKKPEHLCLAQASFCTLAGLMLSPTLQYYLFDNRVVQFTGRISFSIYIYHGPMIWTIGANILHALTVTANKANNYPDEKKWTKESAGWVAFTPVILSTTILSYLQMVYVDEACVKWISWVERKINLRYEEVKTAERQLPLPVSQETGVVIHDIGSIRNHQA